MAAGAVRRALDARSTASDARRSSARCGAAGVLKPIGDARHAPSRHGPRLSGLLRRVQGDEHLVRAEAPRARRRVGRRRPRAVARRPRRRTQEILAHLRDAHPDLQEIDCRRMVHAVRRHAHLMHARETAAWTTRPVAIYERVRRAGARRGGSRAHRARPPLPRARSARRRGPTSPTGPASACATSSPRSTGCRRYRDEDGRELLDVPRAPLPPATRPRRCASCRNGTTVLLAFADRRAMISDEHPQARDRQERRRRADLPRRRRRRGECGSVEAAASASSRSRLSPASGAARSTTRPHASRRGSADADRRAHLLLGRHRQGGRPRGRDGRRVGAGLHAEPAHVAADEPRSGELRALPREARGGRPRRRRSATRSTSATSPRPTDDVYEKSVAALRNTIEVACAIGADGVVFHVGSHLGAGFEAGLERVVPALEQVLELCTDETWLLMENSAGAGGTIGRSIEELATIYERLDRHPRLGVCLDSCHLYVSGVDVTDPAALDALPRRARRLDRPRPAPRAARQRLRRAVRLEPRPAREHPRGRARREARRLPLATRACRDCPRCSRPQARRTTARTRTRSARRRSCARAGWTDPRATSGSCYRTWLERRGSRLFRLNRAPGQAGETRPVAATGRVRSDVSAALSLGRARGRDVRAGELLRVLGRAAGARPGAEVATTG